MNLLGGLDEDEVSHGCLLRANVLEKKNLVILYFCYGSFLLHSIVVMNMKIDVSDWKGREFVSLHFDI